MSLGSTNPTLRHRRGSKKPLTSSGLDDDAEKTGLLTDKDRDVIRGAKADNRGQYRLALAVIAVLAFLTRFYAISHPSQVVFDEVHFGKVSSCSRRGYTEAC